MRKHPGHFSTSPETIAQVIKSHGKTEMKFKDGQWRKVANGKLIIGKTRTEVRNNAKA